MEVGGNGRLRFGDFEFDLLSGKLFRKNRPVKIQPQPLRVLGVLLERAGEIVPREQLRTRVWGDATFVEFDQGLNYCIRQIRLALHDGASEPLYIETLPKQGYRFIARVAVSQRVPERVVANQSGAPPAGPSQIVTEAVADPTAPVPPNPMVLSPELTAPRLSRSHVALGILALLAIAGAGYYFVSQRTKEPFFYASSPLTNYVGSEISPSFSPDGGRIAFAWNGEKQDNFDIYVKQIGVEAPLRLTNDPRPELSPAWSPDGRMIAFVRRISDDRGEVLLTPSIGEGTARSLATFAVDFLHVPFPSPRFLAWSPDGKWLAIRDSDSSAGVFGLFLLSIETGEKRRLTLPPVNEDDSDPAFSPDGRQLAFVRYSGTAASDLYLLQLSTDLRPQGTPERLTFTNRHRVSPVWTLDGKAILFSRYEEGPSQSLWRVVVSGDRHISPVPVASDNIFALALSKQGSLVYTRGTSASTIWTVPLSRGRENHADSSRAWSASSWSEGNPQVSPDGQKVVFQSYRSGATEIWIADLDGSHARQLTNLRAVVCGFPRWSPDGKNIVFHSRPQRDGIIYVVAAAGGRPRRLTDESENNLIPSWSRDGKWIYFFSRKSGEDQIWKMPASGGPEIQVTHRGGRIPLESPDGQYLYYTKAAQSALWRMPVGGGAETLLATDVAGAGLAYAPGKTGVYYVRSSNPASSSPTAAQEFVFLRFDGRVTSICATTGEAYGGLAISPDESWAFYSQDILSSDLMIVENFH